MPVVVIFSPNLPRLDADTVFSVEIGLLEKLRWDQMHLAQIGL